MEIGLSENKDKEGPGPVTNELCSLARFPSFHSSWDEPGVIRHCSGKKPLWSQWLNKMKSVLLTAVP